MTAIRKTAAAGTTASLMVFASASVAAADDTVPELSDPPIAVDDSLMSEDEVQSLTQQLDDLNQEHDMTLGMVAVESLDEVSVNDFTEQVAQEWGLGDDEGMLIILVTDENQTRIVMGDDFSDVVGQERQNSVMNEMGDGFNDSWFAGLETGVTHVHAYADGEDPLENAEAEEGAEDEVSDSPEGDDEELDAGDPDAEAATDDSGSEEDGDFWTYFLMTVLIAAPLALAFIYLMKRKQMNEAAEDQEQQEPEEDETEMSPEGFPEDQ